MNYYLLILLLGLAALLQTTLVPALQVFNAVPNLVLLVVVGYTMEYGSQRGLIWAFIGGLWLDLLAGTPFGASAIALLITVAVIGLMSANLFRGHVLVVALGGLLAGVLYGLIMVAILTLLGRQTQWLTAIVGVILPNAVYDAVLLPLLYPVVRWVGGVVNGRQVQI